MKKGHKSTSKIAQKEEKLHLYASQNIVILLWSKCYHNHLSRTKKISLQTIGTHIWILAYKQIPEPIETNKSEVEKVNKCFTTIFHESSISFWVA